MRPCRQQERMEGVLEHEGAIEIYTSTPLVAFSLNMTPCNRATTGSAGA